MKLSIDDQIDVWIENAKKTGDLVLLMNTLDAKSIVIFKMLEEGRLKK